MSPWPGSTCVAPPSASAAITRADVVPGALMTRPRRPCPASRSLASLRVVRLGVGRASPVLSSKSRAGEGGEPGEAPARRGIERIRHGLDPVCVEAPLVAGIEGIARRLDARDQRLLVAVRVRCRRGLPGLLLVEDGPVVGAHGSGLRRLVTRDLGEVADVRDAVAAGVDRPGAGHVDGDEALDPARTERIERRRAAADLLGHREHVEAEPLGLGAHRSRVLGHRVEIEQVGAGGHPASPVKRNRGFEERPVSGPANAFRNTVLCLPRDRRLAAGAALRLPSLCGCRRLARARAAC